MTTIKVAALALLVAGCGGGGGGGGSAGGGSAGGGAGGGNPPPGSARTVFATGAISGFGSVIVNGVRYETEGAEIELEGRRGTDLDLRVGQVVRIEAEVDSGGRARARSIQQDDLIQGRVEAVDATAGTLTIAGQVVRVDNETMFDDSIPTRSLSGVAVGDLIEVHGYAGAGGARATRIEKAGAAETEVEVTGVVANLDAAGKRFSVGTLVVDYATAVLEDFGSTGLAAGQIVEVKGTEFLAGGVLKATRVQREDRDFDGRSGDESEVEGLVTRFVSATDFDVAGQRVTTTATTVYVNGTAADLGLNVKVEAEGTLDANDTLVATKVAFKRQSSARLAAPVTSIDAGNGTLTALGITIVVNATTRLEDHESDDHFFNLGDLRVGDWIEVGGYVEPGTGRLIASRLERDDVEDEVEVRGPATDVGASSLKVLGVTVELVPGTEYEDGEASISRDTFLARAPGQIVDAEGAWNGAAVVADKVEIEHEDDAGMGGGGTGGGGTGGGGTGGGGTGGGGTGGGGTGGGGTGGGTSPDGAALYAQKCQGCHGPISPIFSRNSRDAARIQSAIDQGRGGMGSLSTLTSAEVQAIAAAVAAANP